MASISRRNGRFLVRVRKRGFPTVCRTFTLRADASAWARQVVADIESGRWEFASRAPPTLTEAIREYRKVVASKMKGATTYRYRFDEFEALPFAGLRIDKVKPGYLATWRDEQAAKFKPATVARKLAMLSGIFNWALKERGWVSVNPLTAVRKPRSPDGRSRTLTEQEISYLMAAARSSKATWLPAALTVLMHTAMRRSELTGLKRADVDLEGSVARLHDTKNGSARAVPLSPAAIAAMRNLVTDAANGGREALLPIGPPGSLSTRFTVTVRRARSAYVEDCARCGTPPDADFLADLRLHDLRHHAVTMWASSGQLTLVELMGISGHKTPQMLTRYTHLGAAALASKMAVIAAK